MQPKIGRQTCWEGLWKLSQRAQGLACGHRIDVLQVRFKPISAAAKSSVFCFPTKPLIPKPKETGRLDPFTATQQNRISPGRPNLSNPRLSLMSKGREGRECDAVHPLSALGEEWDAGPATVPVWSSGPSPIQAADEINLASDKFPPNTGIPGSHVLRWFSVVPGTGLSIIYNQKTIAAICRALLSVPSLVLAHSILRTALRWA